MLSSISHIPVDFVVIAVILAVFTIDAMRSGLGRVATFAIALPLTSAVFAFIPHAFILGAMYSQLTHMLQSAAFIALFVVLYFFSYRIIDTFSISARSFLDAAFASIAATVVFLTIWVATPELSGLWQLQTNVATVFGASYALFWLVGAYGVLAFFRS